MPTKYGAVDAVIKREIPYSKLVSPWKKAARAVPFVGTGLVVLDILSDYCIRPLGVGSFEQCFKGEQVIPAQVMYASNANTFHATLGQALQQFASYGSSSCPAPVVTQDTTYGGLLRNYHYFYNGRCTAITVSEVFVCNGQRRTPIELPNGTYQAPTCAVQQIQGYNPVDIDVVDEAIDSYPANHPDKVQQQVPKLWGDLHNRPEGTPLDQRSVDATGLSEPTITPKTPADTSKAGPKTTETTSTGTKVTQETSTITYQGNTTTVTNNTTVTNINNEGDIVDNTTVTEQGPTDCEKNPSAIGCLELGDPPSGDIPRKDEQWQVTAESLPGGACPGGFVWPVPGNPEFSWQPLCDRLPAARAVLLVLASVLAAWIVVGGFQS